MTKNGKVLFFNENDGKGIIITSEKRKMDFYINEWADFDVMPSLGLEILFDLENERVLNITSQKQNQISPNMCEDDIQKEEKQEPIKESACLLAQEVPADTVQKELLPAEIVHELIVDIAPKQQEIPKIENKKREIEKESLKAGKNDFKLPEVRPESITISASISKTISNHFKLF